MGPQNAESRLHLWEVWYSYSTQQTTTTISYQSISWGRTLNKFVYAFLCVCILCILQCSYQLWNTNVNVRIVECSDVASTQTCFHSYFPQTWSDSLCLECEAVEMQAKVEHGDSFTGKAIHLLTLPRTRPLSMSGVIVSLSLSALFGSFLFRKQ